PEILAIPLEIEEKIEEEKGEENSVITTDQELTNQELTMKNLVTANLHSYEDEIKEQHVLDAEEIEEGKASPIFSGNVDDARSRAEDGAREPLKSGGGF
ncbi:hypothetical protein PIB30_046019, partial [Stylosanthes scabra]|nr:hypothetical protein [Stylosanthes scabra]